VLVHPRAVNDAYQQIMKQHQVSNLPNLFCEPPYQLLMRAYWSFHNRFHGLANRGLQSCYNRKLPLRRNLTSFLTALYHFWQGA
jgi:hypothetical protein